ncbi:MAG: BatD family protein, partial [bacterium]
MRYHYILFLFFTLFFFSVESVYASKISVNIQVDKSRITLDDRIRLTISVEGSSSPDDPQLPSLDAFDVISSGRSSRIQIVNGRMTSSIDFNYILIPNKKGRFTIPPISLKVQGKNYTTSSVVIEVTDSAYTKERDGQKRQDDVFITASIDEKEP